MKLNVTMDKDDKLELDYDCDGEVFTLIVSRAYDFGHELEVGLYDSKGAKVDCAHLDPEIW